jgi:excisionase family DNA binding protein
MLTVRQVAERLGLSRAQVYAMCSSGKLPHHRFGGAIRVSEEQLAAYLRSSEVAPAPRKQPRRPVKLMHLEA